MISRRLFLGAAAAAVARPETAPPKFGPGRPLFLLGDEVLEDHWQVERRYQLPKRIDKNPLIKKEFEWEGMGPYIYGSVLRDDADGLYKCWYTVFSNERYRAKKGFPYRIAYATSKDGYVWEKPKLGLVDSNGSTANNLIQIGKKDAEAIDVTIAPQGANAPARYVGMTLDGGVHLYVSDDGLRFRPHAVEIIDPKHSDCHNSLCWDARRKKWLAHIRPPVYAGPGWDKRRIAVLESADLTTWSRPVTVVAPDEQDAPEFYSMPVFQRGNLFFGFLQIYEHKRESLEIELVYSADGYRWERLPGKPIWLGTGPAGSFDSGMVTTADDIVVMGDRMLTYYGGWNGDHKSNDRDAAIGVVESPRDRFIGWHTEAGKPGYLLTRVLQLDAEKLTVNANAKGGVAVAAIAEDGTAIPGFSYDDCVAATGDSLKHPVAWKQASLGQLRNRPVRLRVRVTDGAFYSMDLA